MQGRAAHRSNRIHAIRRLSLAITFGVLATWASAQSADAQLSHRSPTWGGGEEPWIYLKPLFLAELGAARALRTLAEGGHPLPAVDIDNLIRGKNTPSKAGTAA